MNDRPIRPTRRAVQSVFASMLAASWIACVGGEVDATDYALAEENGCLDLLDVLLNCNRPLVGTVNCQFAEEDFLDCACPSESCTDLNGRTTGNRYCGVKGELVNGRRIFEYRDTRCSCTINSAEDRFRSCIKVE
jgi:hypothetical protein